MHASPDEAQAEPCFRRAIEIARSGRGEEALEQAHRALDSARPQSERGAEAWTLRLLGDIYALGESAHADAAEDLYRQSLALATELGMRPLVAHCHLGLCTLYARTGRREQAQEPLTTATAMYREMGMRFWLDKAEAEMAELA